MIKKPNIAVIIGGDSSEFEVSIKSGDNIFRAIDTKKYTPWLVRMKGKEWKILQNGKEIADIDKSDFTFSYPGEKVYFDFAYITIHGTPGEDGVLQGYFDLMKIPYSTSNLHSSSLTFNKWFCNNYLRCFGIKMGRSVLIEKDENPDEKEIIKELGLPVFVKPHAGGSSFGITKVKNRKELYPALIKAWKESRGAIVEEFIEGAEYTCGLVKLKNEKLIFPLTEVIPRNEFFDYEAKYTPGVTEEITPARLPDNMAERCRQLSSRIYDLCRCSGIVRVDYILNNGEFYFLEVNITPGMTDTSFIPQQIKAMGLTLKEVISRVIEEKLKQV